MKQVLVLSSLVCSLFFSFFITYVHCNFVIHAVKSFVELVRYLLKIPGVPPFLSRRVTQDPLEKFFGLQRQRGRVNENPNVAQFLKNTQALRVVQTCTGSVRGNCRGNQDGDSSSMDTKENHPLHRRPGHKKK